MVLGRVQWHNLWVPGICGHVGRCFVNSWWLGWPNPTSVGPGSGGRGAGRLAMGDFDNDGKDDLVFAFTVTATFSDSSTRDVTLDLLDWNVTEFTAASLEASTL